MVHSGDDGAVRPVVGVMLFVALAAALIVGAAARLRPEPQHPPAASASPASPGRPATPGPSPSPAPVQVSPAAQLAFPSATQGWLLSGGQLLATVNGGRTFSVEKAGSRPLQGLDFLSPSVGWALSASGLWATSDAGETWTPAGEPPHLLGQVSFWDPKDGLGLATDNSLWRTADGGRTWAAVDLPAPAEAVCGASPTAAWVVAAASVYRSADGGASWQPVYRLPDVLLADSGSTVACAGTAAWVAFQGSVGGGGIGQLVVRSLDQGATWVPVLGAGTTVPGVTPLHPSLFAVPGPMALAGPGSAFFSGSGAGGVAVAATMNGGTTVAKTVIASPSLQISGVAGMAFADPAHGWALAASQRSASLLQTADGGAHWGQVAILPG